MWSRSRAYIVAAVAGFIGRGLAGCGFQPLYARDAETGVGASDELAKVLILPIRQRTGQQMHNLLRDRLTPRGQPRAPCLAFLGAHEASACPARSSSVARMKRSRSPSSTASTFPASRFVRWSFTRWLGCRV